MNKIDFREIASMEAGDSTKLLPVIEKEILHYDILRTMSENGFLEKLCFQGGISLRLCYGSERFSEDLDFTGGPNFDKSVMKKLKEAIEETLNRKYGLEVSVKEPKKLEAQTGISISAWQVKVVTSPGHSNIPSQKIKIEVANIPSYTRRPVQLNENYPSISGAPVIVGVQDMEEIMVDKLLAFPMAVNIRYRDIWDLNWMSKRGVQPRMELLPNKINDYSAKDYQTRLETRIKGLAEITASSEFHDQMSRFLKQSTIDQSLAKPEFVEAMTNNVRSLLSLGLETPSNTPRPKL